MRTAPGEVADTIAPYLPRHRDWIARAVAGYQRLGIWATPETPSAAATRRWAEALHRFGAIAGADGADPLLTW